MAYHNSYCSVDNCYMSSRDGVPFFRCPRDPVSCQKWKENLGFMGEHKYAKLTPNESHSRIRICSLHFDDNCFTLSRKRLLKTAVPSGVPKKLFGDIFGSSNICRTEKSDTSTSNHAQHYFVDAFTQTDVQPSSAILPESEFPSTSKVSMETKTYQEFVEDSLCQTAPPRKQGLKRKKVEMEDDLQFSKVCRSDIGLPDVLRFLEENYKPDSTMLIRKQLLLLDKSKRGARYLNEFKQFALKLYLLGPKAYRKLSKVIRLPSETALTYITQM